MEGLQRAANRLHRNPRIPRADIEGSVVDPIGAAYNTVRDAVDEVFDSMGGGEDSDVTGGTAVGNCQGSCSQGWG